MVAQHRTGLPIVHLECDFRAITRMGEIVEMGLSVQKLGGRSLALAMDCHGADGTLRVSAVKVLVFTHLDTHTAITVPPQIRTAIEHWMGADTTPEFRKDQS